MASGQNISEQENFLLINITEVQGNIISKIISQEDSKINATTLAEPYEINFDENGNIILNVTVNNYVKIQDELEQCKINVCDLIPVLEGILDELKKETIEDEFPFFEILVVVLPIATGIAGLIGGGYISDRKERIRNKKELDKIHLLLSSDFSLNNRLVNLQIKEFKNYLNKFEKENYALHLEKLQMEMKDPLAINDYTEFLKNTKLMLKFTFWETLERNGSLIKLEPTEIKTIQITHDIIIDYKNLKERDWNQLLDKISKFTIDYKTAEDRAKKIKTESVYYIRSVLEVFESIKKNLNFVDTIPWINLLGEIHTPEISKLIREDYEKKL